MSVKKWNEYLKVLEENTPVSTDTTSTQDFQKREEDLTRTRNEVNEITNNATRIAAMNDVETIKQNVDTVVTKYQTNRDSFVTVALSYLKAVADKKTLEIRLEQYNSQLPELQSEVKSKMDQLNSEINNLHQDTSSEIEV